MSDLSQEHEHISSEPDENVLIEALRNQDDIPILMDIVGEHVSLSLNQETYFSKKMASDISNLKATPSTEEVSEQSHALSFSDVDAIQLQTAIQTVIERLLPTIVEEVVKELSTGAEASNNLV